MGQIGLKAREGEIAKMVTEFCSEKNDAEYASLCEKMLVRKLGRKGICPLERGRLEIWAVAVIYTVATMNFLLATPLLRIFFRQTYLTISGHPLQL